jgi:predicted phosphodiesterase
MRRFLLLLVALAAASSFAAAAFAQSEPYRVFDTRPVIVEGPYLVATSDTTATIVWLTDTPSHSKVRYGTGGALTKTVEPEENGMVPVGTRQVVQLTDLEPGTTYSYQAVSTRVVKLKAYWPDKGLAVESPTYQFTTFDARKPQVSFSVITDTHEDVRRIDRLMHLIDWKTTDFLVQLGDAFNWVDTEDQLFRVWLEPLSAALAHTTPLIFARGNHDMRGPFARRLFDYVPAPEGRFFFARDAGPVHLIVVDTTEDKPDDTNVYAGLNRTVDYRAAELAWLRSHVKTAPRVRTAPFRVIVMHQPHWGWLQDGPGAWTALANDAAIDLVIAGHNHRFSYEPPGDAHRYHLLVLGQDQVAQVEATSNELTVVVTGTNGTVVKRLVIDRPLRH